MSATRAFIFHAEAVTETTRLQSRAAAPDRSVWVAASAGTGKTKVLTDRILRLMLAGAAPEQILCLTYTKAAAAEMAGRLVERLTQWVTLPNDKLHGELAAIGVEKPDATEQDARQLFARVLDCPGGLKIQTLHSFCQSVLARFPLESGLAPNFTVLEESRAAELRAQAFNAVVTDAAMVEAVRTLHVTVGEYNLRELLIEDSGSDFVRGDVAAALHIAADVTAFDFQQQIVSGMDEGSLRQLARVWLEHGSERNKAGGAMLAEFLAADTATRLKMYHVYCGLFFTASEGGIKAQTTVAPKAIAAVVPNAYSIFMVEALRLQPLMENIGRAQVLELTRQYATLRDAIELHYRRAKRAQGAVDYTDLIKLTEKLLTTGGNAGWVMYKLDAQIRHILVDEAQDTSPAQWQILEALAAEFTTGQGASDALRTLFVVGDEKQSIYSFNGADPNGFVRERGKYQVRFQNAKLGFDIVPLTYSFRSVSAVLNAANDVFAADALRQGVSTDWLEHLPARSNDFGSVEVWPLFKKIPDATVEAGWVLPAERSGQIDSTIELAWAMAGRIGGWLSDGAMLESRARPIMPQDVMILVQKRGVFMQQIVRALKEKNIPVAGVDRLTLTEQLAVQDAMALMHFVLLPEDDLNLAALLKSPLIGFTEEQLFDICHGRRGSVWSALREGKHTAVTDYLARWLAFTHIARPYEFLQAVLRDDCPADGTGWRAFRARMGAEVVDPLNELLNEALAFETDHTPTLQGFARHMTGTGLQKKRELSQAAGEVRVMTVHAAKGLQAPIVFLADAAAPPEIKLPRVLNDENDQAAPSFYVPSSDYDAPEVEIRRATFKQKRTEEYRRLMYVAMTRAEDRLIVCGTENKKNTNREPYKNWYAAIEGMLKACGECVTEDVGEVWRYTKHSGEPAKAAHVEKIAKTIELPVWAYKTAPVEPSPARPLAPSRVAEPDAPVQPPYAASDSQRFAAGNLTHKMLEVLPAIPHERRAAAMDKICSAYANEVSGERMAVARREVETILDDATFAPLFGPGSLAEVPLAGLVGTNAINGQIDRLLVTEHEVLVVDYKSNRPPPQHLADVPVAYLTQLACYAAVLGMIYPNRQIRCALLWTDAPRLMEIPAETLSVYVP